MKTRSNPELMIVRVNSGDERLWNKAKKLKPDLTKKEFNQGLQAYFEQHGCYPESVQKIKVPWKSGPKTLVWVGDVPFVHYDINRTKSRKGKNVRYIHKPPKGKKSYLVSDPISGNLVIIGQMRIHRDGWIHG